jgi:hypothetical protein
MKQYKFDYIREMVEKWNPEIEKTLDRIEFVPFMLTLPWIMPGEEYRPVTDYYGETVDNFEEWHRQREEYCKKLAKEYEDLQNKGRQPDKS